MPTEALSRMSTRIGHPAAEAGFTLLEMIVVILLISLLLGFSIPKLQEALPLEPSGSVSRWLMATVRLLKNKAREEQRPYALVVDLDRDRMWTEATASEDTATPGDLPKRFELPPGMALYDVLKPQEAPQATGTATIRFFPTGYSEKAVIHFKGRRNRVTAFMLEPFLPEIERYDRYQSF
jgi:prepilin-type N-terminal cleavage/methylation domain-containing protein